MEGKREGEEAEAAGRPEMQEAAGSGGRLCACGVLWVLGSTMFIIFWDLWSEAAHLDLSWPRGWTFTPRP